MQITSLLKKTMKILIHTGFSNNETNHVVKYLLYITYVMVYWWDLCPLSLQEQAAL